MKSKQLISVVAAFAVLKNNHLQAFTLKTDNRRAFFFFFAFFVVPNLAILPS
jgi:hypothetical protein